MFAGRYFDISDPGETENYGFDFVNDLMYGDVIVGATWELSVSTGVDPNPSAHLNGTSFLVNSTTTAQQIKGLLNGVVYIVKCTAITASGQTIVLWSHIQCQAAY